MKPEHSFTLIGFPDARYHPKHAIVTWHPHGVLDDKLLDEIAEFIELQEHGVIPDPFHRYTDLSHLTDIQLKFGHVFEVAKRRRISAAGLPPVKSAIFSNKIVGFGMARMYETLMDGAAVQVRAFREQQEAAEWLDVPLEVLSEA